MQLLIVSKEGKLLGLPLQLAHQRPRLGVGGSGLQVKEKAELKVAPGMGRLSSLVRFTPATAICESSRYSAPGRCGVRSISEILFAPR